MIKPLLKFPKRALPLGLCCAVLFPTGPASAGEGGSGGGYSSSLIEAEIAKRQLRIQQALEAEAEGDRLRAAEDYEGAVNKYREALDLLPLGSMAAQDRARVISKFSAVSVIHARELGQRGAFDKARAQLNQVLSPAVDPNNKAARELLADLDDPDMFNPAMSEKHYEDTEEVRRLFRLGNGYYDLGKFDEAQRSFNRILAIDPTNIAARRRLEDTEREINNYLRAARDHTRLRMLNDVDRIWETTVAGTSRVPDATSQGPIDDTPAPQAITFKLRTIKIPELDVQDATIPDIVALLTDYAAEYDTTTVDPTQRGVNILLKSHDGSRPVTLRLRNVTLENAIRNVCNVGNVNYRFEEDAVIIMSHTDTSGAGVMQTKTFRVPPDFLSMGGAVEAGGGETERDPFDSGGEGGGGATLARRPDAKTVLENLGVLFPDGASATYNAASSKLVVRNTLDALDIIGEIVEDLFRRGVQQVFVQTRFVEVTQRNTDEFGFDTLLGAFNVGSSGIFGSGGTPGNTGSVDPSNYAFLTPTGAGTAGVPVGTNPVSRSLRFGADAINRNAIDSLLSSLSNTSSVTTVSPAAFALAGVFTDPQFQIMMRALSQKKGVDLMTAPSIIVKSGTRSKIEVIREFPYPTEYDPPQIPQTFGNTGSVIGGGGQTSSGSFPVTPSTPQQFEFKNTGVTLEVEATVGQDGYTIDLNLLPEIVEFEGFVNYGSPIQTSGINALGLPETIILTDNQILQPVFSTRRLTTNVVIWDRQTVGIGGLIREDVQSVEDKVPLVGDIPFLGKLFQTKTQEHFKRNLMIYVTGTLIDPAGQARSASKTEEGWEPDMGGGVPTLFP